MSRKLILPILLIAVLATAVSCNKSSEEEYNYTEASSATVTGFSLTNNSKVLDSLQNVFFSIDLVNLKIFNADSLPYGTKVTSLIPKITTPASAKAVELAFYSTKHSRDSVVNFLTNSTDSIDFTNPVRLTVTSESGAVKLTYEIKVNVHKVKADSLCWYKMESAPLPTKFGDVKAQYTAKLGDTFYCLTTDGSAYCLATTTNPADPQWATEEVTYPFSPKVETLRASDTALYILDTDGYLYTSTDAKSWTSTSQVWHNIYGAYLDDIIGCVVSDAGNKICCYPSGKSWPMPANFPVDGASMPATYAVPMGYAPQLVMVGGRTVSGVLTAYSWGFDGENWAEISTRPLPTALEYVTMTPYKLVDTPSSTWTPVDYPVLLAFGGRQSNGTVNRTVYYSRDWGMTWREAPELMQLPDALPTCYGAAAYEYTTTMYVNSRSEQGWSPVGVRALPPHWSYELPMSRATEPLTQWECPAIYLFGGRDYNGKTLNNVWRGVITQFTFEPVQ